MNNIKEINLKSIETFNVQFKQYDVYKKNLILISLCIRVSDLILKLYNITFIGSYIYQCAISQSMCRYLTKVLTLLLT